jgi:hypothetical protein
MEQGNKEAEGKAVSGWVLLHLRSDSLKTKRLQEDTFPWRRFVLKA